MTKRLCLCGYMWRLTRPFPHRLRMRINVVAGWSREVAVRLNSALGIRPRTKGRAEVLINRPGDIVKAAEALGCPSHVLEALKSYALAFDGGRQGIPVTPQQRARQELCATQVLALRPPPVNTKKVRKKRANSLGM